MIKSQFLRILSELFSKFSFRMRFAAFLLLSYLFIPQQAFNGWFLVFTVGYMVSFSLSLAVLFELKKEVSNFRILLKPLFVCMGSGLLGLLAVQLTALNGKFYIPGIDNVLASVFSSFLLSPFDYIYVGLILGGVVIFQVISLYLLTFLHQKNQKNVDV